MKKILYYISDHGHGHATRAIALIEELQKKGIEIIIRNSKSMDILKKSIPNCRIIEGITDVGPSVKNDGLTIDLEKSKKTVGKWIESFEKTIEKEARITKEYKPDLIISDISAMPFVFASKIKIPSIAISNFSWYDSFDFLTKEQSRLLDEAYKKADLVIQLPFGTKMEHFKKKIKVGIIARQVRKEKNEVVRQLKMGNKKRILLAMGNTKDEFTFDSKSDIDILSIGGKMKNRKIFNYDNYVNGHELVSISDLVICKLGYGVISECLTNGIPFIYTTDENRVELKQAALELERIERGIKMTLDKINQLTVNSNFINSLSKPVKISNQNTIVVNLITDFLK